MTQFLQLVCSFKIYICLADKINTFFSSNAYQIICIVIFILEYNLIWTSFFLIFYSSCYNFLIITEKKSQGVKAFLFRWNK